MKEAKLNIIISLNINISLRTYNKWNIKEIVLAHRNKKHILLPQVMGKIPKINFIISHSSTRKSSNWKYLKILTITVQGWQTDV